MNRISSRNRHHHRRGTTYLLVVSIAAITSLVAIGSMTIANSKLNRNLLEQDLIRASRLASSSIEIALDQIESDVDWRSTFQSIQNGEFSPTIASENSELKFGFVDPVDQILEDRSHQPFRILGRATSGTSRRALQADVWPADQALDVLRCTVHSNQNIACSGDITVEQGVISANQNIDVLNGSISSNLEAKLISQPGHWVHGSITSEHPEKDKPSPMVFDLYDALATEIPYENIPSGVMTGTELGSTENPFGSVNSAGIYVIRVPAGQSLTLNQCKLNATLLVDFLGNASQLTLGEGVIWEPALKQLPAMISRVQDGDTATITLRCEGSYLSQTSSENARLQGLFHVVCLSSTPTTHVHLYAPQTFSGCLISDANVELHGPCDLKPDPSLVPIQPAGYTTAFENSNLINNGDFSKGHQYWNSTQTGLPAHGSLLAWIPGSNPFITVTQRGNQLDGIFQDVTSWIENGNAIPINLQIRSERLDDEAAVELEILNEAGVYFRSTYRGNISTSFSNHSFSLTPSWTGTLRHARLKIHTTQYSQDFSIDQVVIDRSTRSQGPKLFLSPGSVQRDEFEVSQ